MRSSLLPSNQRSFSNKLASIAWKRIQQNIKEDQHKTSEKPTNQTPAYS